MTSSDPTPVVEVKRFHEAYPGMPDLYHTYCSACPNYGTCDEWEAAESSAWEHAQSHGTTVTPNDPKYEHGISLSDLCEYASHRADDPTREHPEHSGHETPEAEAARRYSLTFRYDGDEFASHEAPSLREGFIAGAAWQASLAPSTPGDHDELLAEAGKYGYLTDPELTWTLLGRLATALRTEQSARQAAEELWDDALINGHAWKERAVAAERRIDAALTALDEYVDSAGSTQGLKQTIRWRLIAPTESKEPDHE